MPAALHKEMPPDLFGTGTVAGGRSGNDHIGMGHKRGGRAGRDQGAARQIRRRKRFRQKRHARSKPRGGGRKTQTADGKTRA